MAGVELRSQYKYRQATFVLSGHYRRYPFAIAITNKLTDSQKSFIADEFMSRHFVRTVFDGLASLRVG